MRSKLVRTVILGMALSALSALGAASASAALPEFKPSGGTYPVQFTFSGGASFTANSGAINVHCESLSGIGVIINSKEVEANATFSECRGGEGSFVCWNEIVGSKYLIKTEPLQGTIGYYEENKVRGVGLELWKKGALGLNPHFAAISCTGQPSVLIKGAIIGKLSPLNKSQSSFALTYENNGFSQSPNYIEGGYHGEEQLSWNYGPNKELSSWLLAGSETLATSSAVEITG